MSYCLCVALSKHARTHVHYQVTQKPNLTLPLSELINRLAGKEGPKHNTYSPIRQGLGEARASHLSPEPVRNKHFHAHSSDVTQGNLSVGGYLGTPGP